MVRVRLSGVYFAMLTLAFAQIVWSIAFQWVEVTGGDNGILGVWPATWAASPANFFWLSLGIAALAVAVLRVIVFSPFGYALRATRDSPLRSEAIGINGERVQWAAFVVAGTVAALGGALFAFLKGSVFPDSLAISLSVDGLVMVLLGGVETVSGAVVGAIVYKAPNIWLISQTDLSKLVLGLVIVVLVVAFPKGIVGALEAISESLAAAKKKSAALPTSRDRGRRMSWPLILEVENLSKSYGGVHAVRDVSFEVRAGAIVALIGPNGAGKSTCFNMLNGQIRPDAGRCRIRWPRHGRTRAARRLASRRRTHVPDHCNLRVDESSRKRAGGACFVPEGTGSVHRPPLSVIAHAADSAPALVDLLEQADRAGGELAYGDVKRLELAIALANEPTLLLMDEPTAGMAPKERNASDAADGPIARERQIGVLFTEHDMDVVFEHADRVMVLNRGVSSPRVPSRGACRPRGARGLSRRRVSSTMDDPAEGIP